MSAYICNPEHFAALAHFAVSRRCVIRDFEEHADTSTRSRVAAQLAWQNIASVAARYPNDMDGERPGPCMLDQEIATEAGRIAVAMALQPPQLSPLAILAMCQCYEYQACEATDYDRSPAALQIGWIRSAAIRALPGYDDISWHFETDDYSPENVALAMQGKRGPISLSALFR